MQMPVPDLKGHIQRTDPYGTLEEAFEDVAKRLNTLFEEDADVAGTDTVG